ncbi:MAG: 4a-hydroxytetrahydrobiopterin dehydratase [Candidatus Eisenbacteria bacterium]|nr:4a-hydroxytetrahydrobiopterin dehydratase [Candidatus Eisenbacteria bacterium]
MSAKELLSDAEIKRMIAELPAWKKNGKELTRTVEFPQYLVAIDFVHLVAEIAEQMNHHPDIEISHSRVTLHCTTHSAKGITARDVELAQKVEEIYREQLNLDDENLHEEMEERE